MNIGIDFDDTIINCNIIKETSHEFNFNLNEVKNFDWELSNFPNKLREEIYKRFESPYYMTNSPFIYIKKGASEKLAEWKGQGHNLFLITARSKNIRNESRKLIKKIYSGFDKIHFVNIGAKKTNIFRKEKLDVWIDDNPKDCDIASRMGIDTYMISNKSTPYNYHMKSNKKINVVSEMMEIEFTNE